MVGAKVTTINQYIGPLVELGVLTEERRDRNGQQLPSRWSLPLGALPEQAEPEGALPAQALPEQAEPEGVTVEAPDGHPHGHPLTRARPTRSQEQEKEEDASPSPSGRAHDQPPHEEQDSTAIFGEDDEVAFAERIRGLLPRGIDSISDSGGPRKRPKVEDIVVVLRRHQVPNDLAYSAAVDAREICLSQDRAPNIVGLFDKRLAEIASGTAKAAV
jgi:hypothetical protein